MIRRNLYANRILIKFSNPFNIAGRQEIQLNTVIIPNNQKKKKKKLKQNQQIALGNESAISI